MKKYTKDFKQLAGGNGKAQVKIAGVERVFSIEDTKKLIKTASTAKTKIKIIELGRMVYGMIKKQDQTPPEYV